MPSKPPKAYDVWFVTANTVYKAVPYSVVADWAQEGRLAGADKVRPAGTNDAWTKVADNELLADYLPQPIVPVTGPRVTAKPVAPVAPVPAASAGTSAAPAATQPQPNQPVLLPDAEPEPTSSRFEDDDEVDMIPLIDISMVLLVFFIMIQAAGALAPVDVPEMKYAGELTNDPEAITITIEKRNAEEVYYAVRVGQNSPQPNHDNLNTPEDAISAMKDVLATRQRPPEVRIACRKDLPRERVYELRRKLEIERKQGQINNIVATVVEAPEQK